MNTVVDDVRWGDAVLATALTALGVLLMVENIHGGDATVRIDSHSWLLVPVFAAATVPILWRRRNLTAVFVVTAAALVVHVVAFGWVVRCGAGLPLAVALAYAAGRLWSGRASVIGLLASIGIQGLVLVEDSAAGWHIIPVTAAVGAVAWGIGCWLRSRSAVVASPESPAAVGSYS
jgi:hypothetical protein